MLACCALEFVVLRLSAVKVITSDYILTMAGTHVMNDSLYEMNNNLLYSPYGYKMNNSLVYSLCILGTKRIIV